MNSILTIVNILLLAALGYVGVQTYDGFNASPAPEPSVSVSKPRSQQKRIAGHSAGSADYRVIARRNLFNTQTDSKPVTTKVDVENLQQTKLKLKLWGTVVGLSSGEEPYAVIEAGARKEQNLHRVGDTVENALIKMILREKVILSVAGIDEILEIEKLDSRTASGRKYPTGSTLTSGDAASSSKSSVARSKGAEQQIALKREQVSLALENVNELVRQVRMRPHFKDGKPDGLRVTGIKPNSLFRKLGFRNGDVLSRVNGENIGSIKDALEMLQQFNDSAGMAVEIKRRGRDKRLTYSVSD